MGEKQKTLEPIDASPVKSFFVRMLTRDIKLEDAILDLLDNCVDGILRGKHVSGKTPYSGYYAHIEFNKDIFSIADNCGGIPWAQHEYAFRMGRPDDRPKDVDGTVGVYGIGMKRAIFKMGKQCLISTQSDDSRYEVEIDEDWIDSETWKIPVKATKKERETNGTTIVVSKLYNGISESFGVTANAFTTELVNMVATHYAFIIAKGFEVKINGALVEPRPTSLIFDEGTSGIKPYIFKASHDGVEVFLAVGFTRPIPSQNEVLSEQEEKKYSSLDAGWTILCNDRAVVYCNRDELTGWGEAGVPRYHTQFIAISGIVEFRSTNDASKLPTTTTKRGIDASSPLYLQVKNKMREGMQLFTDYTNKWKGQAEESKKHMDSGKPLSLDEIKRHSAALSFKSTRQSALPGQQFKPELPMPKKQESHKRRISYLKDLKDIEKVAEYLFEDAATAPEVVGEKCFDLILREAK